MHLILTPTTDETEISGGAHQGNIWTHLLLQEFRDLEKLWIVDMCVEDTEIWFLIQIVKRLFRSLFGGL